MIPASVKRIAGSLVLAVVAIAFIVLTMGRFSSRGEGPPRRPAVTIEVGRDASVAIQPAQYHQFEFRLPARVCTLTGEVKSLGPTRGNFEALVFNDDEFRAWLRSQHDGPVRSGAVTFWNPQVTLVGPGRYHLVVRDAAHSAPVRIGIVDGRVTCP